MLVSCVVAFLLSGCVERMKILVVNYTDKEVQVYLGHIKHSPSVPAKSHAYLNTTGPGSTLVISAQSTSRIWAEKVLTPAEAKAAMISDDVMLLEFK